MHLFNFNFPQINHASEKILFGLVMIHVPIGPVPIPGPIYMVLGTRDNSLREATLLSAYM